MERYLRDFSRVVSLADQGLNAVMMIRQVTGRLLALVNAYLDLYRRYDRPEHCCRLAQLRPVFAKDEAGGKGVPFPFPYRGCHEVRWQEEVFGPLRTMENAQVLHLAEHYDLSRDSRLAMARAIVRSTKETLDAEESRRQVVRVRPEELFLETGAAL